MVLKMQENLRLALWSGQRYVKDSTESIQKQRGDKTRCNMCTNIKLLLPNSYLNDLSDDKGYEKIFSAVVPGMILYTRNLEEIIQMQQDREIGLD